MEKWVMLGIGTVVGFTVGSMFLSCALIAEAKANNHAIVIDGNGFTTIKKTKIRPISDDVTETE